MSSEKLCLEIEIQGLTQRKECNKSGKRGIKKAACEAGGLSGGISKN
jgi:hypothetical protein